MPPVLRHAGERVVERWRDLVEKALRPATLGACGIRFDDQRDAFVHRDRERLGSAHTAEAGGHNQAARERSREVTFGDRGERLECALEDALGPDVDPGSRGHLTVHRESGVLEAAELVPCRPARDDERVGDEHAGRPLVRAKDPDRLP